MSDVIREFLVSLGFKADGADQFADKIQWAQTKAVALGEAMYDTAKAVGEAVANMATGFDQLYWQTKRLGDSASDIKAYGYAISQLGGDANGAQSALENIAEFMKSYPGAGGWLTGLGVDPKHIGHAEQVARDLAGIFAKMPYYLAKQYASVLGIDPIQLQAMQRDTGKFEAQYKQFAHNLGIDLDAVAGKSNEFMTNLREMKAEFGLMFDYAGYKVMEFLLPKLEALARWVRDMVSGDHLGRVSSEFRTLIIDIGHLLSALDHLANSDFGQRFMARMLWAIDNVIRAAGQMTLVIEDLVNRRWSQAWKDAQHDPTRAWADVTGGQSGGGGGRPDTTPGSGVLAGGSGSFNHGNMRVPGGRAFQQFSTAAAGARAMAAQIIRDQNVHGARSIYELIAGRAGRDGKRHWGWAPREDGNNPEAYAAFIAKRLGINANATINFSDPNILSGMMSAMMRVEQGHEVFSADRLKGVLGPGRGGVSIAQQTTINVHGGGQHVANDIAGHQDAVNQRLVSNASVFAY